MSSLICFYYLFLSRHTPIIYTLFPFTPVACDSRARAARETQSLSRMSSRLYIYTKERRDYIIFRPPRDFHRPEVVGLLQLERNCSTQNKINLSRAASTSCAITHTHTQAISVARISLPLFVSPAQKPRQTAFCMCTVVYSILYIV